MKPYWIGFLIVFLHTYVASAENSTCTWSDDDTNCIITPGDDCNQITSTTTIDADTYLYCSSTNKTWYFCDSNDSKCVIVSGNTTPCEKDYIFHNNRCISCAELTGEENAYTTSTGVISMNSCILPGGEENVYTDEKGTFTYSAACNVECTEDTAEFCTSA